MSNESGEFEFREFDKIMVSFPLCCLSYPTDDSNKIQMIYDWCIVERARGIKTALDERVNRLYSAAFTPEDFDLSNERHCQILLACDELKINLGPVEIKITNHELMSKHIQNNKIKYGKDAYCRIGKDLIKDVIMERFSVPEFLVLCAIQSILGAPDKKRGKNKNTKFKRITKDQIRFRMFGCKTRKIGLNEIDKDKLLFSDKQIGRITRVLEARRLITKFTYAKRQTFYTTRLNYIKEVNAAKTVLGTEIGKAKEFWFAKVSQSIEDKISQEIRGKLSLVKFPIGPGKSVANA